MHFQIPKQQWNKIEEYLKRLPEEERAGISLQEYLELMDKLLALCPEESDALFFPLAVCIAKGGQQEKLPLFCRAMTRACEQGTENFLFGGRELAVAYELTKEYDETGNWAKAVSVIKETLPVFSPHEGGLYGEATSPFEELVIRFQMQLAESLGERKDEEAQRRGGLRTLMTQSVTGQLPYGGEESQSLFCETLLASVLEFEAAKQAEEGNFVLAGRFRRGARRAIESVLEWVASARSVRHFFDTEDTFVKMAVCLSGAVLFAPTEVCEHPAPCEEGGYVLSIGDPMNQIVACGGGYSIQITTHANQTCRAVGLGRFQKRGIPLHLGLSTPQGDVSIGVGWDNGEGGVQYLSELGDIKHALSVEEEKQGKVKFTLTYTGNALKNCGGVMETYSLDEGGLRYSAKLLESECNAMYAKVPLLITDGKGESIIKHKSGQMNALFEGCRFRITSNGSEMSQQESPESPKEMYRQVTLVHLEPKIRLNLSLCREKEEE